MEKLDYSCSLGQIKLLRDADKHLLAKAEANCNFWRVRKGEHILDQDSLSRDLYFLISGRLKVVSEAVAIGKEVGFAFIEAGHHFGEFSLIDEQPRSANVEAMEESIIGVMSAKDAIQLLHEHPEILFKLLKHFAALVRRSNERLIEHNLLDARGRIAMLLLELSQHSGEENHIYNLPNQTDIASMTSTTRETVSRTLTQFQHAGLIQRQGRELIIVDPKGLKDTANILKILQ